MLKLAVVVLVSLPGLALANDFDGWKVPDGVTLSPNKCNKKNDATECLHMAWAAEAGSQGIDETSTDRLVKAQSLHQRACELAKRPTCPNAARVKNKLDHVAALKTDADKDRFWCAEALDGAKLWKPVSNTAPIIAIRGCMKLFPQEFHDGLDGLGKATVPKKQIILLQAALDHVCPALATKPAECSTKAATKLSVAKQRAASAKILGASFGGDLAARGDEMVGWLTAK